MLRYSLLLDFSKAFDTVRHSTLLQKIALLDLPDFVYNWLVDFFEGRSHCTAHNDLVSEVAHILASIIQGSVIGPASYVVNVSDLRTVKPENDLVKYADDTDLIVAEEHVETRFEELDNISTWADVNDLKLNKAKSVEIVFRRPRSKKAVPPPPIPGIARVEEFSFLGVTFWNNFSVETHVNDIIGSCARTLYGSTPCAFCVPMAWTTKPFIPSSNQRFSPGFYMRHQPGGDSLAPLKETD